MNHWSNKQRQGHQLHRICAYQGSFPPQLPAFFLDKYTGGVVLDPFCGRGTTILESALRGNVTYGVDLLSVSRCLSGVKLSCPPLAEVLTEIAALDLTGEAPEPPEDVAPFYHPETWRQLWNLRNGPRSEALLALTLGRLHGHSPGFFSATTFNVISVSGSSMTNMCAKHGTKPEPRDLKALLRKAATRFIPTGGHEARGCIFNADARSIPLADRSVDLVITSPPFLDVIDYESTNWLRAWFLGDTYESSVSQAMVTPNVGVYVSFLADVLQELSRLVRSDGRVVMEVGPVKRHHDMVELVKTAAADVLGFVLDEVITHDFSAAEVSTPKISRAMRGGMETTTMSNHCVVLRRL